MKYFIKTYFYCFNYMYVLLDAVSVEPKPLEPLGLGVQVAT